MSEAGPPAASELRQSRLLVRVWWLAMRRRGRRVGDTPKLTGVPTFLLINLLSLGYLAPIVYRTVTTSTKTALGLFGWHALGIALLAVGSGLAGTGARLQARAVRDDAFLDALPLGPFARLVLSLVDGYFALLIVFVTSLAGALAANTTGLMALFATCFGWLLYLSLFLLGCALAAWVRVWGPAGSARGVGYVGVGLLLLGFTSLGVPLEKLLDENRVARVLAQCWLKEPAGLAALYLGALLLIAASYGALRAAERAGFDRVQAPTAAPGDHKRGRTRVGLERVLIWRQGGRILLVASVAFTVFAVVPMAPLAFHRHWRMPKELLMMSNVIVVYFGALQTIAMAGRAARGDLAARPFLAALPLTPHQVLEGKASALRLLLLPMLFVLVGLALLAVHNDQLQLAYGALIAGVALSVLVSGAVAVSFMSSGVGVAGVAGGQAGSSFSTQLLLMPLLATALAPTVWVASASFLSVVAVSWEASRAARQSVRWLDDPDEAIERETTVWRALLAFSVFVSLQMLSGRLLALFDVPSAYTIAISFFAGSCALILLTWRDRTRFTRPAIGPSNFFYWPLGLAVGAAAGALVLAWTKTFSGSLFERAESPSPVEIACLALTMVVVAPIAEEYFFRGWLQQAIERDLPARYKPWAFALAALAFALAHVGSLVLPQLLVGLAAGALVAGGGGLGPAMVAHAAYNGFLLWSATHQ